MVPLTFCVQTKEVKEKRILYKVLLTIFDLVVYSTFVGIFVFEYFDKEDEVWFIGLFWNVISIIICIALCIALKQIRLYSHDFATENLKSNTALMWAHQGSFILGTLLSLIRYILLTFAKFSHVSGATKTKLALAEVYFNMFAYVPWFIVIVLMLKIFLKYAKPQSDDLDDEEKLISNGLLDRFESKPLE